VRSGGESRAGYFMSRSTFPGGLDSSWAVVKKVGGKCMDRAKDLRSSIESFWHWERNFSAMVRFGMSHQEDRLDAVRLELATSPKQNPSWIPMLESDQLYISLPLEASHHHRAAGRNM
jgi:hypothetical protein